MIDVKSPGNEPISAAARDTSGQDADPAPAAEEIVDESDAKLPAPLNNGAYRKILKELPDGPRIAAETCVQFWKDKKFPTEELVAFLKTISVHSPSLKKGFDDQHNGFLRAMKLQEEQQRKREEEQMARRHEGPWMANTNYPTHLMMESMINARAMYMGGMHPHEMTRYSSVLSRAYGFPHDMYHGGMGDYGGHERAGTVHHFDPEYMRTAMRRDPGVAMPLPSHQRGGPYHTAPRAVPGQPGRFIGELQGVRPVKRGRGEQEEEDMMVGLTTAEGQQERLPKSASASHPTHPAHAAHVPPVMDADLAAARTALKGKYPRDLFNDALGTWLTQRAHAVTSAVFVKVIANVRRRVRDHAHASGPGQEDCGGGTARQDGKTRQEDFAASAFAYKNGHDLCGAENVRRQHVRHAQHATRQSDQGGGGGGGGAGASQDLCYYRSKAILAFRCLPGSVGDALTFGMYVHEYGAEAPPSFRGKVLLECIDGTPLFNGETADERQRCLSAIAQGYMDFVASEGFTHLLIRVPPPTDTNAHLFSPRNGDVQLKASQHLSQWYVRLIEYGMRIGTVSDYRSSPDGSGIGFPLSILSARDCAAEVAFKTICAKLDASEPEGHHLSQMARSDRYFVAALNQPDDALGGDVNGNLGRDLPIIVCPLAANRQHFTNFCRQKRLMFHSIDHAQYSTMILLKEFLQQRQLPYGAPPSDEELDEAWERQAAAEGESEGHEAFKERGMAQHMLEPSHHDQHDGFPLPTSDEELLRNAKRLHAQDAETLDEGAGCTDAPPAVSHGSPTGSSISSPHSEHSSDAGTGCLSAFEV